MTPVYTMTPKPATPATPSMDRADALKSGGQTEGPLPTEHVQVAGPPHEAEDHGNGQEHRAPLDDGGLGGEHAPEHRRLSQLEDEEEAA